MSPTPTDPGSFRDPSGQVFVVDGRVYRTVMPVAAAEFEFTRRSGVLGRLARDQRIIDEDPVAPEVLGQNGAGAYRVLEHPRLPVISYPYEWCFGQLKTAALHHLALQLELLDAGITLSDASAYNVQFCGPRPIFIDALSFRRYVEGEYWLGHRQFCEQFLNPLLLRALFGVAHNRWYRGSMAGISAAEFARLLRPRHLLSWNVLTHVFMQGRLQRQSLHRTPAEIPLPAKKLPRIAFKQILRGLHDYVRELYPADRDKTLWEDYAADNSYAAADAAEKRAFVARFAAATRPKMICDIGCNTGDHLAVALQAGAENAIGLDFDQGCLERLFARTQRENLRLLPLFCDFADPSPSQGWAQAERPGVIQRCAGDAVLALGVVHHLAIGRNLPVPAVIDAILGLASQGVMEFVQKSDPMTQALLKLRTDIFPDYREEAFEHHLSSKAEIVQRTTLPASNRKLYWFRRR